MLRNRWLKVTLAGSTLVLEAYPGAHNSFARRVDLRKVFPGAYGGPDDWPANPPSVDVDDSLGLLR